MAIRIAVGALGTGLTREETTWLQRALAGTGRATLIVPSFAVRDACRRELARAGMGVGVDVLTLGAWVASLWELLGDGRRLVGGLERKLLMAQVLAGAPEAGEGDAPRALTPGIVALHARAAAESLPYIERAGEAAAAREGDAVAPVLSAAERALVQALARYGEELDARGLTEPSVAARLIADQVRALAPACARAVAVHGVPELPEYALELLEACAGAGEVLLCVDAGMAGMAAQLGRRLGAAVERCAPRDPDAAGTAADVPAARFAEVAGPSARDAAHTVLVLDAARAGDVVAASPDPLALARHLAPRLAARGVASRVEARLRFSETRAGELFFMLIDVLDRMGNEEPVAWWPAPELVDWIRSPFAGVWSGAARIACASDKRWRGSRLVDADGVLRELRSLQSNETRLESDRAQESGAARRPVAVFDVLEALGAGDYRAALQAMLGVAQAASPGMFGQGGMVAKQVEVAALGAALACLADARRLGTPPAAALPVLSDLPVKVSAAVEPAARGDGLGAVAFAALDAAAEGAPASAAAVLLLDLDADTCPCARQDTPATVLARKLGCAGASATPAERQRVTVRRALAGGRAGTLAYVARTREGEEVFPAFALDELKNALGAGAAVVAGLPTEYALAQNLDPSGGEGLALETVSCTPAHALPRHLAPYLYLPDMVWRGAVVPRRFSASSIEAYLSCPYKWLVTNRARSKRLDAAFGPIERGNFVHDIMQRFHERLIEAGLMRVTPENVERALELMRASFEELKADHARGKFTHGKYARQGAARVRSPYVPLGELERSRLASVLPMLEGVVRAEADMLPIFTPELFEYSFDAADLRYAGRPLGGRIDRIDVAPDAGSGERFVVIDYKTGGSDADMASPDPTAREDAEAEVSTWIPGRDRDKAPVVQTLIYAQAYRRIAHASPQGAAYLITRGPKVAAMVDEALTSMEPPAFPSGRVYAFPDLPAPGKKSKKPEGTLGFTEMLDAVEAGIAEELDRLEAGEIAPAPAKDSCKYCPIKMCEKRR
ncbi:PD-(D/E)XK nuclease family protein [[Collinsella] massiliensis]|uniref:PD-(D/E)XK endonuclease-like domain-containing protein n=2 Tax=Coriobacteriaceae TaxID=84107 RepID=A0A1Y3XR04_9ACTN|nr:PD-(D/E)XK nuclease family protein [[Collinsella] massiliensis]OUN87986.1 hypothetical protein B5G02_06885 [[Collinsella] massiliensis]